MPRNLPTKSPEEAEKHRQQYEAMVEAAKKKGTISFITHSYPLTFIITYYEHCVKKTI